MFSILVMLVKGVAIVFAATRLFLYLLRKEDARWLRGPINMFPIMFAVGMLGHTIWVAYAALLLLLPVVARSRAEAVILFPMALMTLPPLSFEFGFAGIYLLRFDKLFFLCIGLAIAGLRHKDQRVPNGRHFDVAFWLMLLLALVPLRDNNLTGTLRELTNPIVTVALPYLLASRWLKTPEDVRRFILAFACSAFVMSIVAIVEARTRWLMYDTMNLTLGLPSGLSNYSHSRGGLVRAVGAFAEATGFGLFLVMGFLTLLASRSAFRSKGRWFVAVAIMLLGIVSCNTRNAFLGLVIGLITFDLYRGRFGALAGKIMVVGLCYTAALAAAQFSPYVAASIGKTSDSSGTAQYRELLWERGKQEIWQHPLFGRPMSEVQVSMADLRQGEGIIDFVNGYVYFGVTAGVGGMVALLLIFVSTLFALVRARRDIVRSADTRLIGGCLFAISAFSIVTSFYTGFGGPGSTPYLMLLAACSALIAGRRLIQSDAISRPAAATPATPQFESARPAVA